MKMIMCVIDDMDTFSLLDALSAKGIQTTKLTSSGGFLRRGNTTLLIGIEDERKDEVLGIIEEICAPRKQMVPMAPMIAMSLEETLNPSEITVQLGGDTTFVMDVVEHYKL